LDTLAAAYAEDWKDDRAVTTCLEAIQKEAAYIKRYQRSLKDKGFYSGAIEAWTTQRFRLP